MKKVSSISHSLSLTFAWILLGVFLGGAAGLVGIYLYLSPNLPAIDELKTVEYQTPLQIYSIDNKLIGEFGEKRRYPISIDEAPQFLVDAVISAEDDGFYEHNGVSFKGLLRAVVELISTGEIQSGGSTITMQVARNFFLTLDQTFSRKFNEILLALKIEKSLSKGEILALYFNKINFGNRAYGVKAAAQVYYGKTLDELTLAQSAMIAGLPKAPSKFNPLRNPERALIRRDWILQRMLYLEKIDQEAYDLAIAEPVSAQYFGQNLDIKAPYIAEMARDKALELFGNEAYNNGYKVYTTVDSRLQEVAQTAIVEGLLRYDERHGYRGVEQSFDPELLQPLEASNDSSSTAVLDGGTTQLGAVNLLPWLDALSDLRVYGGLEPAAVVRIEEQSLSALMSDGKTVDILWENGLQQAKPRVNENATGSEPEKADDIVSLGDVIRIYEQEDGQWHLAQLPDVQAAMVALRADDGSIQSLVGGFDFYRSKFNRATQAERQPGSNFKPFIYTAGLESGLTPASLLNDAPVVIEDASLESVWRPENSSGKFYGPTRLRKALYLSRNLVSIRLLQSLGIRPAIDSLERFGIDIGAVPRDLSMALGSHVMTPLDVAVGYSAFANGGYKIEPYLVHHIRSRENEVLYQAEPKLVPGKQALAFEGDALLSDDNTELEIDEANAAEELSDNTLDALNQGLSVIPDVFPQVDLAEEQGQELQPVELTSTEAEQIIDERVVYLMNSMLRDVIKRGTGRRALALNRNDLAGKTGTTNGPTDAWFSGYNPSLAVTTWVGFDSNEMLGRREYGGIAALPIWIDYMREALEGVPEELPPQPNGIVTVRVDADTGERATANNPNGLFELFLTENAPAPLENFSTITQETGGEIAPESEPESLF